MKLSVLNTDYWPYAAGHKNIKWEKCMDLIIYAKYLLKNKTL